MPVNAAKQSESIGMNDMGTLTCHSRCCYEDPRRPGRCALVDNRDGRCPPDRDCDIMRDGPHPGETMAQAVTRVVSARVHS